MQLISFNSTLDIYSTSFTTDDSGAVQPTYALLQSSIPCRWQEDPSQLNTDYKKHQNQAQGNVYFDDADAYANMTLENIVVINSKSYTITATQNAGALNKLYKVSLLEDISGNGRLP